MMYDDSTTLLDTDITREEELNAQATQWSDVVRVDKLHYWQLQAFRELHGLLDLPDNWDSYGSPPPSSEAARAAVFLLESLSESPNLPTPQVLPVSGGGIQLAWRKAKRAIEVDILPSGELEYLVSEGSNIIAEEQATKFPPAEKYSLFRWLTAA